MPRALIASLAVLVATPVSSALADKLIEPETIAPVGRLSERIRENLNDYSNDMAAGLAALSVGLVDMRFDLQRQRARLHLGGGDPDAFRLRIDSDLHMTGGNARVQAKIDLALVGRRLTFEVPDFDMNTSSVGGERALQLSLPLLEGVF